jgi:hypothetical protein
VESEQSTRRGLLAGIALIATAGLNAPALGERRLALPAWCRRLPPLPAAAACRQPSLADQRILFLAPMNLILQHPPVVGTALAVLLGPANWETPEQTAARQSWSKLSPACPRDSAAALRRYFASALSCDGWSCLQHEGAGVAWQTDWDDSGTGRKP